MKDSMRPAGPHKAGATNLPLTRNHLYALGALSLALALLSFFVGFQTGRGQVIASPTPTVTRFVPNEVATGDLEVLLARVEQATVGDTTLGFPAELPRTDVPPVVVAPVLGEGGVLVEPPVPPPEPNPFPVEARPGGASLAPGEPEVVPSTTDLPTSPWAIQVGEQAVESDADRHVETLQAAGLAAYKVVALVGGKTMWRVRIGGYSSKDAATAALSGVSSKAGVAEPTVTRAP